MTSPFEKLFPDDGLPIPVGCKLVHTQEIGDEIISYSFTTRYGVVNTYESNESGG
jgi:hypothetical protein